MKRIKPCPVCGSENIEISDCGYSSFNVGWGRCKSCDFQETVKPCGCFPKDEIISYWNSRCLNYPKVYKAIRKLTVAERRLLHLRLPTKPRRIKK